MFESAASGVVRARRATAGTALLIAVALATSVTAAMLSSPAWATTLTVETTFDEQNTNDRCSLREAIINANENDQSGSPDCPAGGGADRIDFGLGDAPVTITLASQLPAATDGEGLIVDGEDARIAISGNDAARVFEVGSGAELVLRNLTLEKGLAHLGEGGAILNRGNLMIRGSTLRGNSAGFGGGLHNSGTATVSNSTLSGNVASGSGGGIHNLGTLAVSSTTLFDNSAGSGGGIDHAGGSARLKNTIVAGSTSGGDCHRAVTAITDGGYNLDSDNTCGLATAKRSRPGANPRLDPLLADNGGPSPTHALLEESPAVDRGDSFGVAADQRGLPRPTDLGEFGNARGGDGSDIGAYEMVKCSGGVVNAAGTVVGNPRGEVLKGTVGDDTIFGLGGNDTIFGGGGNDEVCSGKGDDALYGGDDTDKLLGGEGKDKLQGGDGDDRLEGLKGDDSLDTKDGVQGNDEAYGGTGQDTCRRTDPGDKKSSCR